MNIGGLVGTTPIVIDLRGYPGFTLAVYPVGGSPIDLEFSNTPGAAANPGGANWIHSAFTEMEPSVSFPVPSASVNRFVGTCAAIRISLAAGTSPGKWEIAT